MIVKGHGKEGGWVTPMAVFFLYHTYAIFIWSGQERSPGSLIYRLFRCQKWFPLRLRKYYPLPQSISLDIFFFLSGPEHIDLIFEYGGWVLKSHPEDGLKIFIGDKSSSGEVDQLPRPKILNFLKKTEKSLVIPYLVSERWHYSDNIKSLYKYGIEYFCTRPIEVIAIQENLKYHN